MKKINKLILGVSLIEMLIVISIFAVLGIVVTESVALTIRGSKKSEAGIKVRENLGYSLGVIERQLRNADSIVTCPNPDTSRIDYSDQEGSLSSFSCGGTFIASGSARLTSDEIEVTNCAFTCSTGSGGANPPFIEVSLEAHSTQGTGVESGSASLTTKINLRSY